MKIVISIFFILNLNTFSFGQSQIKSIIINSRSKSPIPFASITILKEKIGCYADKNGVFEIISKCLDNDSIVISSVGYELKKISISNALKLNIIEINENNKSLNPIVLKSKKRIEKITLNKSNYRSNIYSGSYILMPQIAQSFNSPFTRSKIKSIHLCKLKDKSSFRLIIYSYDSISGKPLEIKFDTLINPNAKARNLKIIFEDFFLETKKFYIAIEWIFEQSNLDIQKIDTSNKEKIYKMKPPEICLRSKIIDEDIEIWQKTTDGYWKKTDFEKYVFQISVDLVNAKN